MKFFPKLVFFAIVMALPLISTPVFAAIDATLQMQLGNPSNAGTDTNNHNHFLIQRPVEALDYSDALGEPNWVSWDLTASDVGNSGRSTSFFPDTSLPADFYEVTDADYNGVGNIDFNRGHMCPSEDRTDNTTDNDMVFLMSNIIPQAAANNQGPWEDLEDYCRSLAQAGNELLITCGPSGFDGTRIPSGKAAIPQFTWKIIVVVPPGPGTALSRIAADARVITIKMPNSNTISGNWTNYITSASQIQADTGLAFFTAIPTNIAAVFLNEVDGEPNPPPGVLAFTPSSGAAGTSVVITGTNFTLTSAVAFNGVNAAFTVDSPTQVTATVPDGAAPGPISVTTPGGTALTASNFIVTGAVIDLVIDSSHAGNFTQGDIARDYQIVVANQGTVFTSGTVTVTDALPPGITAIAINGDGWTISLNPLTCSRSDALAAGAAYPPITIAVNVATNAPATGTNVASVSGGGDTNAANSSFNDVTVINSSVPNTNITTLVGWDMSGVSGFGISPFSPTVIAPNLVVTNGLTRGTGVMTVGSAAARGWGGTGFGSATAVSAIAAHEFITFATAAQEGSEVSYTSVAPFSYRHSGTGPTNGLLQYQIGTNAFADIGTVSYPSSSSTGATLGPIDLSGISTLQHLGAGSNVTFRIVNFGGGSAGTWYLFDVGISTALDFAVQGIVSPALTPIRAWRLQWFGTTSETGASADGAVGSSDGMPNLLKYAYGLAPLVPAANPMIGDLDAGHLRVTLPKNPAATDITFHVEVSGDLISWTTNGTVIDQDTATLLQVHDGAPTNFTGSRFMRLRVSRP